LAADWRKATVRELVDEGVLYRPLDGNHGEIHPKGTDFVSAGIPFIMASDLVNGRVDTQHCAFISEEQARSLRKGFAVAGDVLISHKATMGRTAVVGELTTPFLVLTPQVTYYRVRDHSRLSNRFLKFYFDSPAFQKLFSTWGQKGSTRAYLGITSQLDLPILVPPIEDQRAIADTLGTLDDKIELNRRMSETLEAMARALFKSWFVDFEPVRAKSEGRDPGLLKPLADFFPDSFEASALGEIPKGWEVGTLGDVVDHLRANENPLDSPNERFQHFSIPAFDDGQWPTAEFGASIRSQKTLVPPGVVLLSKLNPEIERVWLVDVEPGDRAVCSTEFLVLAPRAGIGRGYVYCAMRSRRLQQELQGLVSGTSKSHQRVQPASVLELSIVRPPGVFVELFDEVSSDLLDRSAQCRRESRTLHALRDGLLPRLLSGQMAAWSAVSFANDEGD
jgi:type I restriction enzyme S subunit